MWSHLAFSKPEAVTHFYGKQNAQSEPDAEPWWSRSKQAMALLVLLWLRTELHGNCPDGGCHRLRNEKGRLSCPRRPFT